MRQHVVEDGLADLQRSLRVGAGFAIAAISGREVTGDLVKQHHAAVIASDPLKDQVEHLTHHLVDVERAGDRLADLVDHIPTRSDAIGLRRIGFVFHRRVQRACEVRFRGERSSNLREVVAIVAHDRHILGTTMMRGRLAARQGFAGRAEDHQRTAQLDAIAAGQGVLGDALAVDKATVATAQVDQEPLAFQAAVQPGVVPRNFGVVQLNLVGRLATQSRRDAQQFKMLTAISAANDKQGSHSVSW